MSSKVSSELENKFMTSTMYKRSKQYFDIDRLNKLEQLRGLSRRKPKVQSELQAVDSKFQEFFISTQSKLQQKVHSDLIRKQLYFKADEDETETNYTSNENKGKTLDMSKMLPRNYFEKQSGFCKNQNQFCNFRIYQIPASQTVIFDKVQPLTTYKKKMKRHRKVGDCTKCANKGINNLEYYINQHKSDYLNQIHNNLAYDQSTFKSIVDYQKYDKEKSERKKTLTPEKDIDRILTGQNMTKKKLNNTLTEFYHGTNKWESSQMDNRLNKQNQYYLKIYNKKNQKERDWSIGKVKLNLIEKRREQILMRKQIKDIKGEICDELYFRRNK